MRSVYFMLYLLHICYSIERIEGWNYINLHCRDNDNKPVDWWYMYKAPGDVVPFLEQGRNFSYITSDTRGRWQPSDKYITDNSMLQHTMAPMYRPTYADHLAVMMYEGTESTEGSGGSSANGIMLADEMGGVWIGHTVPGLPDMTQDRPMFPLNESLKGHLLMCLSLNLATLNAIAASLVDISPNFTQVIIPEAMKLLLPDWNINYDAPPTEEPKNEIAILDFGTRYESITGHLLFRPSKSNHCLYNEFAKSKKIVLDVYGHHPWKAVCKARYSVRNIDAISLKYREEVVYINNKTDRFGFAVSTSAHWQRLGSGAPQYWTCVGSKEEEGSRRGGMLACVEDYDIWQTFDNLKIKEPGC